MSANHPAKRDRALIEAGSLPTGESLTNGLPFSSCDVVDGIWLAAADGRWRSQRGLVHKTRFKEEEIVAALHFLVKYGFAESSTTGEKRFRMITHGPSPIEAVNLLRAVAIECGLE
jgi:hypothetical protein